MYIISFSIYLSFLLICNFVYYNKYNSNIVIIGVREQMGGETFEYLYRISILILYSILFLASTLDAIF